MSHDDVLPVSARFHNLGAGCLDLTLTCGDEQTTIGGSDWLDPYPDMLAWLEDIVQGETLCRWWVEEEGTISVHVCYRRGDGRGRFISYRFPDYGIPPKQVFPNKHSKYDELTIDALIDPEQLVREIYGSLRTFAASPDYDPKEWAYKSVAERLAELAPENPAYEIERVLALPPAEFMKVIGEVDPCECWQGVYLYRDDAFPEAHRLMALVEEADPPIKAYFEPLTNDCFYELPPESSAGRSRSAAPATKPCSPARSVSGLARTCTSCARRSSKAASVPAIDRSRVRTNLRRRAGKRIGRHKPTSSMWSTPRSRWSA